MYAHTAAAIARASHSLIRHRLGRSEFLKTCCYLRVNRLHANLEPLPAAYIVLYSVKKQLLVCMWYFLRVLGVWLWHPIALLSKFSHAARRTRLVDYLMR